VNAFGVCLLGASSVLGVSATARADNPPPIVRVYVAGSEAAVSGSRDAVQELCAHSNVAVVVHDAAGADEALLSTANERSLATAYVDLRPEMPARVVVVDGETHQELERRELPENTTLEISIETAAHIVCAAVDSSLAARVPPPAPAPPASTVTARAPAVAPAPPSATPVRLPRADGVPAWQASVALFAATEDFGAGFRGGMGGAISLLAVRGRLRGGGLITLQGYPVTNIESAAASAGFDSLGARVGPTVEWQLSPGASVFGALGIGFDRAELVAREAPPGAMAQPTPATTDGVAAGLVGARLQLSRALGFLLGVDADVALTRQRYVLGSAQGTQPFFQASRVRPVGILGLAWAFEGAGNAPRELAGGP